MIILVACTFLFWVSALLFAGAGIECKNRAMSAFFWFVSAVLAVVSVLIWRLLE